MINHHGGVVAVVNQPNIQSQSHPRVNLPNIQGGHHGLHHGQVGINGMNHRRLEDKKKLTIIVVYHLPMPICNVVSHAHLGWIMSVQWVKHASLMQMGVFLMSNHMIMMMKEGHKHYLAGGRRRSLGGEAVQRRKSQWLDVVAGAAVLMAGGRKVVLMAG